MPELPEVETIRRSLEPLLLNRVVERVLVRDKRLRWPVNVRKLQKWLPGHAIVGLTRRGKYLLWQMDNAAQVLIHLGMSGRLGYHASQAEMEAHTHVILTLVGGNEIRYRDPRRFGCIQVLSPSEREHTLLSGLGVEPLADDFTAEYLQTTVGKSIRTVKAVLMDGRTVVGIGNIYANEALFHSAIAPQRPAAGLSLADWQAVRNAVVMVLQRAIDKGGTTLNDYRNGLGEPGFFQMDLAVYDRESKPCMRCGQAIRRVVLQGRGTYFCPDCQK